MAIDPMGRAARHTCSSQRPRTGPHGAVDHAHGCCRRVLEMAGGSKLAGVPSMLQVFQAVGIVEWPRYHRGVYAEECLQDGRW
jgi:hypothetical protein